MAGEDRQGLGKWQLPLVPGIPGGLPLLYEAEQGDWLHGVNTFPGPKRRPVEDIEAKRRLYLRLADATEISADGQVKLRPDWRDRAVQFSNLFAPPVEELDQETWRTPIQKFGEEALVMAWTLQLRDRLQSREYASLFSAIVAAVQVQFLSGRLRYEVRQIPGTQPAESEPQSLPVEDAKERAKALVRGLEKDAQRPGRARAMGLIKTGDPRRDCWQHAADTLARIIASKTRDANLSCMAAQPKRGVVRFSNSILFASPLSRIWFGLWEDLSGIRLGSCQRCGQMFTARKAGKNVKRYCGARCRIATNVQLHRKKLRDSEPKSNAKPRHQPRSQAAPGRRPASKAKP